MKSLPSQISEVPLRHGKVFKTFYPFDLCHVSCGGQSEILCLLPLPTNDTNALSRTDQNIQNTSLVHFRARSPKFMVSQYLSSSSRMPDEAYDDAVFWNDLVIW